MYPPQHRIRTSVTDDALNEITKYQVEISKHETEGVKKRTEFIEKERQHVEKLVAEIKRLVRENTQLRSTHDRDMARLEADKKEVENELTMARLENEELADELECMRNRVRDRGVTSDNPVSSPSGDEEDLFGDVREGGGVSKWRGDSIHEPIEIDNDSEVVGSSFPVKREPRETHLSSNEGASTSGQPSRSSTRLQEVKKEGRETQVTSKYYAKWPASSSDSLSRESFSHAQEAAMASIEAYFGIQKVRQHDWYWDFKDWSPKYKIQLGICRDEMWKEYFNGMNGHISIKKLDSRWSQIFWGQRQQSTEYRRRKKLFALIETLSREQKWSYNKVLEYLREYYPIQYDAQEDHLRTASKFIRWLKDENIGQVIEKAADSE